MQMAASSRKNYLTIKRREKEIDGIIYIYCQDLRKLPGNDSLSTKVLKYINY